jgi:hypothetical protein
MTWIRGLFVGLVVLPAIAAAQGSPGPASREMDVATAAMVLNLTGRAAQTMYEEQARCAGLLDPKPLPVIRILKRPKFPCGDFSPTGWCSGFAAARSITLAEDTTAFAHELFHYVLCQFGDCDPHHESPLWPLCETPVPPGS